MLANSPRISDYKKGDLFQLDISQNDEMIGQKSTRAYFRKFAGQLKP